MHKKEEALCLELGDKDGLQTSYANQAVILHVWGRLKEAFELLKKQETLIHHMLLFTVLHGQHCLLRLLPSIVLLLMMVHISVLLLIILIRFCSLDRK